MAKKTEQEVNRFWTKCKKWLAENRAYLNNTIKGKISIQLGPIEPANSSKTGMHCAKLNCDVTLIEPKNPQAKAQVFYAISVDGNTHTFTETVRTGLNDELNTSDVANRLAKKMASALSNALPKGGITPTARSANKSSKSPVTAKECQDAFCTPKGMGLAFLPIIERRLTDTFDEYKIKGAASVVKISTDICKKGVKFKAKIVLKFPYLEIPLPEITRIVLFNHQNYAKQTLEQSIERFADEATNGLRKMVRDIYEMFVIEQVYYKESASIDPSDVKANLRRILNHVIELLSSNSNQTVQLGFSGMDCDFSKSAAFLGNDGQVRVYVSRCPKPICTCRLSSLNFNQDTPYEDAFPSDGKSDMSNPQTIYDFVHIMNSSCRWLDSDLKIRLEIVPSTLAITSVKIGFAEYSGKTYWPFPQNAQATNEFAKALRSEYDFQGIAANISENSEGWTNAELSILSRLQKKPLLDAAAITREAAVPEMSGTGMRKVLQDMQKYLISDTRGRVFIHPKFANYPFHQIHPKSYPSKYKEFLDNTKMFSVFAKHLRSAQLSNDISDYWEALRTLTQVAPKVQKQFANSDEGRKFFIRFTSDDVSSHIRSFAQHCLSRIPDSKMLENEIFSHDIEQAILTRINKTGPDEYSQCLTLDYLRTAPRELVCKVLMGEQGRRFLLAIEGGALWEAKELLHELGSEALLQVFSENKNNQEVR